MCQGMVDIQPAAAEIRRGIKKRKKKIEDRKKLQGKNIMAPLLHRAAIMIQHREHQLWVARLNKLSQQLVEVWQCISVAFEWKDVIFVLLHLPGSAEALVRWGGKIFLKNYQNRLIFIKIIARQSSDIFLRHGVGVIMQVFQLLLLLTSVLWLVFLLQLTYF